MGVRRSTWEYEGVPGSTKEFQHEWIVVVHYYRLFQYSRENLEFSKETERNYRSILTIITQFIRFLNLTYDFCHNQRELTGKSSYHSTLATFRECLEIGLKRFQ